MGVSWSTCDPSRRRGRNDFISRIRCDELGLKGKRKIALIFDSLWGLLHPFLTWDVEELNLEIFFYRVLRSGKLREWVCSEGREARKAWRILLKPLISSKFRVTALKPERVRVVIFAIKLGAKMSLPIAARLCALDWVLVNRLLLNRT